MNSKSKLTILRVSCALLVKDSLPNSSLQLFEDLVEELLKLSSSFSPDNHSDEKLENSDHALRRLLQVMSRHNCESPELARALLKKVSEIYP